MEIYVRQWGVITFAVPLLICFLSGCGRDKEMFPALSTSVKKPVSIDPSPPVWSELVFPTKQQGLLDPIRENVFQPTAVGNPASALFGSVRTAQRGGHFLPTFHEGIDIAAFQRDRQGRPLDPVYAIANGTVAYVSTVAGNSTYGVYVVITHDDPMGAVYSLYAHLAQSFVKLGDAVTPGSILGRMGNTATYSIPMSRAHLHFEIGVILNTRFSIWYDQQKLTPSHGRYHGWNLVGVNPLAFFAQQRNTPTLHFNEVLNKIPLAFQWVIRSNRLPDYFVQYPSCWQGPTFQSHAFTIGFSENGVPLWGRNATESEFQQLGAEHVVVLNVTSALLERNGPRLITQHNGKWIVGTSGLIHLEKLLF